MVSAREELLEPAAHDGETATTAAPRPFLSMLAYLVKRLLGLIPTLLIVAVLVFLFVHLLPGDPARLAAGAEATPETVELVRTDLGLDKHFYDRAQKLRTPVQGLETLALQISMFDDMPAAQHGKRLGRIKYACTWNHRNVTAAAIKEILIALERI